MIPQCKRWQLSKIALLIGLILCQPLRSVANSGEISGQVFKPDGQTPAAGVTVWLSSPDERLRRQLELPRSTRTTKDGRYTFKELIAGEYAVRAVDDSGLVATQSTRLINDDARVGVWLTLRSMAREGNGAIWGYVRDANDNAVTNITVLLRPIGMMGEWQKKNTDEFGMVLWSDVPPGEYEITLVSPRYVGRFRRIPMPSIIPSQRITVQPNKAVKVEFPQITQTQNVVRKPKLIIRGQLVDDKGRPIANTRVYLLRLGMHTGGNMWMGRMQMMYNYRAQTKTDNEGRFTLPLVTIPPVIFVQTFTARWKDKQPRLHAILRAEGFAPITAEFNPPRREAQGGEAEHPLAMPLPLNQPIEINLNTLKLTVRSGDIQVRVVDAITEKPIPNAWVILLPRRTGEALRARQVMMARIPRSKTDDGGIAFLKDIIPGKYRLQVREPNYTEAEQEVEVKSGAETVVTVHLKRCGMISGQILIRLLPGGKLIPLPNARLQLRFVPAGARESPEKTCTIVTDAQGRYTAHGVHSGTFDVELVSGIYPAVKHRNVTIKPGEMTEGVDFIIEPQRQDDARMNHAPRKPFD